MNHFVFVYGTLCLGQSNHALLENSYYVGGAILDNHFMFSLGGFPGIHEDYGSVVQGEIWVVDEETLANLDGLEGHPDFYCRHMREVRDGRGRIVQCWVYVYQGEAGELIPSGDWLEHRKETA